MTRYALDCYRCGRALHITGPRPVIARCRACGGAVPVATVEPNERNQS